VELRDGDGNVKDIGLRGVLEEWYDWLTKEGEPLFSPQDAIRMSAPVTYLHKSVDWLSRTTMANTEWFFTDGSQIVMNRWLKDDYDAYE